MRACAGGQGVDAAALPTEALTRSFNWGDGQALAPDPRTSAHKRARTRARAHARFVRQTGPAGAATQSGPPTDGGATAAGASRCRAVATLDRL